MLVDTSVWVDHLRRRNARLAQLLEQGQVWTHPFVIGELTCGRLSNRRLVLDSIAELPQAPVVDHAEVLAFLERRNVPGRGVGWVDVHLLASAAVAGVAFWTLDRRLADLAAGLGLGVRH